MGIINGRHCIFMVLLPLGLNGIWFASYAKGADLTSYFKIPTTDQRAQFLDYGQEIQLSLDAINGGGFLSYSQYLFGVFNMQFKMIAGESAGTVTTFYLSSSGDAHDELDFEFLGNVTGEPIILQTNIYASGVGNREQRVYLWFDPTADFHNYTILWNTQQIVFYVDGIPIRTYPNIELATGVPYLKSQPMTVYGTIWDGDTWATQGGRIKIDWTYAPFIAFYRDFSASACADAEATSACASTQWWNQQKFEALDNSSLGQLNWVKSNYLVYDYCTDHTRFNVTPIECFYTVPPLSTLSSNNTTYSSSLTSPPSSFSPLASPILAPFPQQSSSPPSFHHLLSPIALLCISIFYQFIK